MANKSKLRDTSWVMDRLNEIREGTSNLSYHLLRQIEKSKLIEPVFVPIQGKRKPFKTYSLTAEGRKKLGLKGGVNREIAA